MTEPRTSEPASFDADGALAAVRGAVDTLHVCSEIRGDEYRLLYLDGGAGRLFRWRSG